MRQGHGALPRHTQAVMSHAHYHHVIIGAGSAGCVLANRLSADPARRVLLLEAGGSHNRLLVKLPLAWPLVAARDAEFGWGYSSVAEEAIAGRSLAQPRGKMLGGTSSMDGGMYTRGHPRDYEDWQHAGLTGWGYADVLPYFRRSERNWRGASHWHGGDGPVEVHPNPRVAGLYEAMIQGGAELGYAQREDFNAAEQEGFGMPDVMRRRGRRESSATAYLDPARTRANLKVITAATVTRIVLQGPRARGVDYLLGGQRHQVQADEVILSAGAFNSPHLLLLSGIGDPAALRSAGVEVRHALPAVGRNLQDHAMLPVIFAASRPLPFERQMRLDQLLLSALRWALTGTGPLAEAPLSVQGFVRVHADSDRPDMQFQISHAPTTAHPWFPGWRRGAGHLLIAGAIQLHPHGRGDVTLASADPLQPPRIRTGLLQHPEDLAFARAMLGFIRRFFATAAVREWAGGELMPGPDVHEGPALDAFLRESIMTAAHPACTCAMGIDPATSVVDHTLRVHGLDGLRIADASVMPNIIGGNTRAPTMMIAEKAADLVLQSS